MTIDKHIYFSEEEVNRIKKYCSENHVTFSKAVCRLTDIALDNVEVMERLDKIQKDLSYSIMKQNFTFALLKQIYSDLDFENITDPKDSKSVIEFMRKLKKNKFND